MLALGLSILENPMLLEIHIYLTNCIRHLECVHSCFLKSVCLFCLCSFDPLGYTFSPEKLLQESWVKSEGRKVNLSSHSNLFSES